MSLPRETGLRLLALALLLAFFAQGMVQITHASLTFDEGPHLAVGYATLRTGDLRLQPVHIHPPLANVLAALPLLLQDDLPHPGEIDGWEIASLSAITDEVIWKYPQPARIATAARVPILFASVLLGALNYRWARDYTGTLGALLALFLFAFDPNLVAHGSLVTTDAVALLLIVATLFVLDRARRSGWQRRLLIVTGLLMGLAQLAKVSALMLVPVVGLVLFIRSFELRVPGSGLGTKRWRLALKQLVTSALWVFIPAALVVWAGYGFEVGQAQNLPLFGTLRLPAATHLRIYQALREHYTLGHPTFLSGRVSDQGWWWYFPVAFVLKTPLPVLILTALAIIQRVLRIAYSVSRNSQLATRNSPIPGTQSLIPGPSLLLFPFLYAAASLFSTVNIGYRHLLPLLPFLYIELSTYTRFTLHISRFTLYVSRFALYILPLLLAWLLIATLAIAPHYLSYFNNLAGGPEDGYRYLVDSNLDWGQNLWDLRAWMEDHDAKHVYYAHYSPARPSVYGIDAEFLPPDPRAVDLTPWKPKPGLYAIGVTVLQGPYAPDINTYAWFRAHKAADRLGNALFVYEVPPREPPGWATVCAAPALTLSIDVVRRNLDAPNLRVITYDCDRSWVFPTDGTGVHLLPESATPPPGAALELTARNESGEPTHTLYRTTALPAPAQAAQRVEIDGPLAFVGHTLSQNEVRVGETLELYTYWRVRATPKRPLSLMAHLISPESGAIAVGDGLGFPIEQWQPGDLIIQRHPLSIPEDAPSGSYALQSGAYWLDTMERWAVTRADDESTRDAIALGTLRVESVP